MTIEVTRLAPFGAEIGGLDLGDDLDDETFAAILDAWHDNRVVVFRGQRLTPERQLAFTTRFGEVGMPGVAPRQREVGSERLLPGVMMVTNIRQDGEPIGFAHDGEMWFHSDMCYVERPHKATMLYAIRLPSWGGNTRFADMYAAYDNLPAPLRARLEGCTALQMHEYKRTERPEPKADMSGVRHFAHPVFVTHPVTGRKALYVNRLMTVRIEELPPAESDELLERLFACAEDPAIVLEHVWREGDLVMWDNRCINHARTDYPAEETRLLRRTTVRGERPAA